MRAAIFSIRVRMLVTFCLIIGAVVAFSVSYVERIYAIDNRGRVVNVRNDYPKLEAFVSPEQLADFSVSSLPWEWIETDSDTDTLYYLRRVRRVAGLSLEQIGVLCFVIRKERFKQWVLNYPVDYELEIGLFGRRQLIYASNGIVKQIPQAGRGAQLRREDQTKHGTKPSPDQGRPGGRDQGYGHRRAA